MLSGLVASCIRTATFFIVNENDVTCTSNSFIAFEVLTLLGVATPRLIWSVVESGMYLSAACLVGLRPVFVQSYKWVMSFSTHEGHSQPPSVHHLISHSIGGHQWSRKNRTVYRDLDSTTNITNKEGQISTELDRLKDAHLSEPMV